jgi:hypothetical protein
MHTYNAFVYMLLSHTLSAQQITSHTLTSLNIQSLYLCVIMIIVERQHHFVNFFMLSPSFHKPSSFLDSSHNSEK